MMSVMSVICRPKRAISTNSGVSIGCTSRISVLMWPSSVAAPVATTTPPPWPPATSVPEYAIELRSASTTASPTAATSFITGTDSPVSSASSMVRLRKRMSRTSALTRSPASSSSTSPGTICSAAMPMRRPARRTEARGASMPAIAFIAFSARPSWMKPISALMITTAMITVKSDKCPSARDAAADASST